MAGNSQEGDFHIVSELCVCVCVFLYVVSVFCVCCCCVVCFWYSLKHRESSRIRNRWSSRNHCSVETLNITKNRWICPWWDFALRDNRREQTHQPCSGLYVDKTANDVLASGFGSITLQWQTNQIKWWGVMHMTYLLSIYSNNIQTIFKYTQTQRLRIMEPLRGGHLGHCIPRTVTWLFNGENGGLALLSFCRQGLVHEHWFRLQCSLK